MAGTKITSTGVLYINGQQVENTFSNISRVTKKLESEFKKLTIGTEEWRKKAEEVRTARARLEEVRKEINAITEAVDTSGNAITRWADNLFGFGETFKGVFAGNVAASFFEDITGNAEAVITHLLEIADAMTDVEKTTGMTTDQVKDLWDAFDEMNTRTSKLDRLKIAEVAGRLGVPLGQMKDFIVEIDKAYVALGDSFEGGLEAVVEQIGTIKGLFTTTKEMSYADAINQIGSALNTLAAQGTASESNISQFAARVGTLPDALKPSIDKVLGLGAAFEEAGINAEIGSSGFSNFITTAGENIDKFAISMRMSKKDAQELLNTKPEEFFLRFAQGMKGLSATETAKVLESLKLGSLEVQKAVGAAANSTDAFRKSMKLAGEEMEKGSSLADEFNKKNNNAPAIIEKIKNAWNDMFTSTNVINFFEPVIKGLGWITGVTKEAGDGIKEFKERLELLAKLITVITVGIYSYTLALKLLNAMKKQGAMYTAIELAFERGLNAMYAIQRGSVLLLAAAKALLTGNITRATAAMRAFSIATKTNPVALLISLVAAATTAYFLFRKETEAGIVALNKYTAAAKVNGDIQKQIQKEEATAMGDLRKKTELYLAIIKDKNSSLEARKLAYEKLIAIYPQFKGTLDGEYRATEKLTTIYDQLISKLKEASEVRAYQKLLDKAAEDRVNKETARIDAEFKAKQEEIDNKGREARNKKRAEQAEKERKQIQGIGDKYDRQAIAVRQTLDYQELKDDEKQNLKKAQIEEKNAKLYEANLLKRVASNKKLSEKLLKTEDGKSPDVGQNIEAPGKKKKEKDPKKDESSAIKEADKANADLLKAQQTFSEEKLKIIEDSLIKEAATEANRRNAEQQNLKIENDRILHEIADLEKKKEETKSKIAKEQYEKAAAVKRNVININNQIDIQQEQTHLFTMARLQENIDSIVFQRFVEMEQRRLDEARRKDEEEIIQITSLTDAKILLKNNEYLKLTETELQNIQTLEDAKAALREAADRKMNKAMLISLENQSNMLKENLKGLTGEAADKLKADLDALTVKITQLKSAIKTGEGTDNKKVKEESDAAKEKIDVLGFSAKDWESAFKNLDTTAGKLKAAQMGVQALANAFQAYSNLQQALNDREMRKFDKNQSKKKKELLKQLNEGYINQEEYHKQLELLDVQKANKEAEIAYKQAKAQKTVQIASAISGTALGIIGALTMSPWTPANYALAAAVGVLGAIQIATIAAQPLPEKPSFDTGGFTGNGFGSPDASGFKAAGIVHENEWVAPKWMLEDPKTANVIDYLESVRTGKTKPMAEGGFSSDNNTSTAGTSASQNSNNDSIIQYMAVMSDVKDLLQYLKDNGVDAWIIEDAENGKKIKRMIKKIDIIENNAAGK
ncbi:phage tail tape measure protein [Chryseobacterium indologenes]|uniref:phage tail tape measure protein n=1 Tax=Chryseobacterium indologenes TaxID=253 RepID=UPI0016265674|nr:phage tail tape measure protein [Chryseobacterium indologenes]